MRIRRGVSYRVAQTPLKLADQQTLMSISLAILSRMEYTKLGGSSADVSIISLGAGGHSRLGLETGHDQSHAVGIVQQAVDAGINLIDTAENYGTESVVGTALQEYDRDDIVLSTKFGLHDDEGELRFPEEIQDSLRGSLNRLGTEYVDVYHLHGVSPDEYEYAATELRPELQRLKENGLIHQIGITETVSRDPSHEMLKRAVEDGGWDVVMVGYNMLNQSARSTVLEPAQAQDIGTIGMVPVRRALSDVAYLKETIAELVDRGEVEQDTIDPDDPFGFVLSDTDVRDRIDAAYRFACQEPTIDTVLMGTGNPRHLEANIQSALADPLPKRVRRDIEERFAGVHTTLGN